MATISNSRVGEETYLLNLGPQHPSTHGVLRVLLKMDGEVILEADPIIGYGHRGHEKMAENRTYGQFLPNTSRMDYLAGMLANHGFCEAVERACGIEVPERVKFIRVITSELGRISSHLLWAGAYLLDLGAFTPFLYTFDDRENLMDLLNMVSGSRLTYCYNRIGGVAADITDEFIETCRVFIKRMRSRWQVYEDLVTGNIIFIKRVRKVGIITKEMALMYGVTGPVARGSGIPYDVRKAEPYAAYDKIDFHVPCFEECDAEARYLVRMAEMEQSLRIIEQALEMLPQGPYTLDLDQNRIAPPKGDYHFSFESARGNFGYFIVSDGTPFPYRIKPRVPSYPNLNVLVDVLKETLVADAVSILGSVDIVVPEVDR